MIKQLVMTTPYDPVSVNGVEPSTHTVTARLDPPREINLDKVFQYIHGDHNTFNTTSERYPFLKLMHSSRKSASIRLDPDDQIPRAENVESTSKGKNYFMNCIVFTIQTLNSDKPRNVSVKAFVNGSFQYTGCQNEQHMVDILMFTWDILTSAGIAPKNETTRFKCRVDMINFGFKLDMLIDRPTLDFYVSQFPDIETCYDTMVNIAINIKMIEDEPEMIDILLLEYTPETCSYTSKMGQEPNSKYGKKVKHTFRVFHGGTVIQSGRNLSQIIHVYKRFRRIIEMIRPYIEFIPNKDLEQKVQAFHKIKHRKSSTP